MDKRLEDFAKSVDAERNRQQNRISEYRQLVDSICDIVEESKSKIALEIKERLAEFHKL